MNDYIVHFTYYNEEKGRFAERAYTLNAEDQFEARSMAWERFDTDDRMKSASCVKQCGVTWVPNPMNMYDYFIAKAAEYNYRAKYIENVDIPNAAIAQDPAMEIEAKTELTYHWGKLSAISAIAGDLGKSFGMTPPDLCDELHYVRGCLNMLYSIGDRQREEALADIVHGAANWDSQAMFDLKSLFRKGAIELAGQVTVFSEEFGRDGFFPEKADVTDNESAYIARWLYMRRIDQLSQLPVFTEKDVISVNKSRDFFNTGTPLLVLRPEALPEECRMPEYLLWKQLNTIPPLYAQNLITNEYMKVDLDNVIGILRPEYVKSIDFDALRQEYDFKQARYDYINSPFMDRYDFEKEYNGNFVDYGRDMYGDQENDDLEQE